MAMDDRGRLLTPGEAAKALGVTVKTLTRWANDGLIRALVTPGGHRRYWEQEVRRIRAGKEQ